MSFIWHKSTSGHFWFCTVQASFIKVMAASATHTPPAPDLRPGSSRNEYRKFCNEYYTEEEGLFQKKIPCFSRCGVVVAEVHRFMGGNGEVPGGDDAAQGGNMMIQVLQQVTWLLFLLCGANRGGDSVRNGIESGYRCGRERLFVHLQNL